MPDSGLDTEKGCEAHKAMAMCIRAVKDKQKSRDHELEILHARVDSKLSTKLFITIMLVILGFLSFNAVNNQIIMRDLAVVQENIKQIKETQKEIKVQLERLRGNEVVL